MRLFDLNFDIMSIVIDNLWIKRYNFVMKQLKKEFMIKRVFMNSYFSGRKIHSGRFFLNKKPSTIYNKPYRLVY